MATWLLSSLYTIDTAKELRGMLSLSCSLPPPVCKPKGLCCWADEVQASSANAALESLNDVILMQSKTILECQRRRLQKVYDG